MPKILAAALLLIFGGSYLAAQIQTDGGRVSVSDVRFAGAAGQTVAALLYVPEQATVATPQPAVLAVHGYINSRETQSGFAIELARRGFVVLALDQSGHGYSDPPAFAHGFGGPDALAWLRTLPMVDADRIGLEGHSMGGWTVLAAADALPDGYAAMVLEGSSTGTFGTREGIADFPRNLLLVFSLFDEFSGFMWESPVPADIVATDKLKTLFDTNQDVVPGKLYGDMVAGTARKLAMPPVTHPGDHLSREAIGAAVDWLQIALQPSVPRPAMEQTWYWKELGTLIALVGIVLLLFPVAHYLLAIPLFRSLRLQAIDHGVTVGRSWWIAATLTALIPILTFFPLQTIGGLVADNRLWSQAITNGIVLWMLVGALISLGSWFWWRRGQPSAAALADAGLARLSVAARSLSLAVLVMIVLTAVGTAVHELFLTDFRFWVVALKTMSAMQFYQFLAYAPLFCAYFVVLGLVLHSQLRVASHSVGRSMVVNSAILCGGFVLLLLVQYTPLFFGGTLAIAIMPLLTIVAIQFVPLLVFVACVSSWCFARTGQVYVGAFVNGLIVCWYVVAGQATHVVPYFG